MKNFTLYTPTRIVFGKEVEKRNRKACKRAGSFQSIDCVRRRQYYKKRAS